MSQSPVSIIWSSQVTHTAVAQHDGELWSATYTVGQAMMAVGMVFDIAGGSSSMREPKKKYDLGVHSNEAVAKAACEAFCRGEVVAVTPPALPPPPAATDPELAPGGAVMDAAGEEVSQEPQP